MNIYTVYTHIVRLYRYLFRKYIKLSFHTGYVYMLVRRRYLLSTRSILRFVQGILLKNLISQNNSGNGIILGCEIDIFIPAYNPSTREVGAGGS